MTKILQEQLKYDKDIAKLQAELESLKEVMITPYFYNNILFDLLGSA